MTVMVELAPTHTLIHRWVGHGDLTIHLLGRDVFLRADQVETLASIPPWSTGETLLGTSWPIEVAGRPFYAIDEAIARCEAAANSQADEFLTWLRNTLPDLLADDNIDNAERVPSFIGSHPVNVAARILSEHPDVSIGRQSLFTHMHALGWIDRRTGDWAMTPAARRNGFLTTRKVRVPTAIPGATRRTYEQLHITPTGLTALAATLTPDAPAPAPAEAPTITLFD